MPLQKFKQARRKGKTLPFAVLTRRSVIAVIVAWLLLVIYIGFLVVSNYRSQTVLREFAVNRFHLDLEKRAAALGYYFSERRNDLNLWSRAREIEAYFTNKALGMSETYGLKVNLFMIQQMFDHALANRQLQGEKIFKRMILLDLTGRRLVDTADNPLKHDRAYLPAMAPDAGEPQVLIMAGHDDLQVMLITPCRYKGKIVGHLLVWLDSHTLFANFIELDDHSLLSGAGLMDSTGKLHIYHRPPENSFGATLGPERIAEMSTQPFATIPFWLNGKNHPILMANLPIPRQDFSYAAWIPAEQIAGLLAPWRMIAGMVALALLMVVGFALVLWFFVQNLVLKTRFDESERQQDLLSTKNASLKSRSKNVKRPNLPLRPNAPCKCDRIGCDL